MISWRANARSGVAMLGAAGRGAARRGEAGHGSARHTFDWKQSKEVWQGEAGQRSARQGEARQTHLPSKEGRQP